jgi:hypothetical protein
MPIHARRQWERTTASRDVSHCARQTANTASNRHPQFAKLAPASLRLDPRQAKAKKNPRAGNPLPGYDE